MELVKGDRIQLHPATDWWMRGARFGTVKKSTGVIALIKLDLGPARWFNLRDILEKV